MDFRTSTDLTQLFIASRAPLREAAARIVGCHQRAEDVLQDAYLKLMDDTAELDVRHPLAYLYRLVRNLAIDRHRRSAFESRVFWPEEEGRYVSAAVAGPEAQAMHTQNLRLVAGALATLPERTRSVFELHRLGGQTQREIASGFGISATLVNFMIRDAMRCCRDALQAG